jgi:predicted AAA+ superfamily ATPase
MREPSGAPAVIDAIKRLRLFAGVFEDDIGHLVIDALVAAGASTGPDKVTRLSLALVGRAELAPAPPVGDALSDWLLDRLLDDGNVLARKLDIAPEAAVGAALLRQARSELDLLLQIVRTTGPLLAPAGVPWLEVEPLGSKPPDAARRRAKEALLAAPDAEAALEALLAVYRRGSGPFGRFLAFRWRAGALHGVASPDLARLESLVGYERERAPVLRNTEQFLAGLPANDVLIAGARGSGKSSTIKGLLTRYAERGLRLVEVAKADLGDLPALIEALRPRRERFIVYVDDLSFEADETDYKALKALLEGAIEARPNNVLIYATSNRRNLISELWVERSVEGEVSPRERQEEKQSLADRFGIRVFFPPADQQLYLRMVESLAAEAGITLPPDELRQRALHWELLHSGRSGRVARQFVIALLGELRS